MNVVVIGSLGFDYIMNFSGRFTDRIMEEKIHSLSLSFLVDTLSKQFGGTAGNIAYSLKLLGIEPIMLACVGNDFTQYKRFLKRKKISTEYVKELSDLQTSSYFVITDLANNQIGSYYTGAMKHATTLSLKSVTQPIDFGVIAPTNPKAMIKAVNECKLLQIPYMYDPAFQISTFTADELLDGIEHAKILIGNDYEISLIEDTVGISHDELISKVPILVTTLGDKGSIIETNHQAIHINAAKAKGVVDPTGAGDAYRAGFLAGFLQQFPLEVCGQMGSVASVYSVELYGTQTHEYNKRDFIRRYDENFHTQLSL